jgi:hypothetical protein
MTVTAGTLYEAVEPEILWKQLFSALLAGLTTDSADTNVRKNCMSSDCML